MRQPSAPWLAAETVQHVVRLAESYRHWTGETLLGPSNAPPQTLAAALWDAPFALLSGGLGPDPICTYGNRLALTAFELTWDEMRRFPARYTAAPEARAERRSALARAARDGFLAGYAGIRVSTRGRRFHVEDGRLWNVLDERGALMGQAAAVRIPSLRPDACDVAAVRQRGESAAGA